MNSNSWPGGCEFDPRLRWTFFPVYLCLSPLQEQLRKVVCGFGKEKLCKYLSESARKHMCFTNRHDMTLAFKVALNPNTTNEPSFRTSLSDIFRHIFLCNHDSYPLETWYVLQIGVLHVAYRVQGMRPVAWKEYCVKHG